MIKLNVDLSIDCDIVDYNNSTLHVDPNIDNSRHAHFFLNIFFLVIRRLIKILNIFDFLKRAAIKLRRATCGLLVAVWPPLVYNTIRRFLPSAPFDKPYEFSAEHLLWLQIPFQFRGTQLWILKMTCTSYYPFVFCDLFFYILCQMIINFVLTDFPCLDRKQRVYLWSVWLRSGRNLYTAL